MAEWTNVFAGDTEGGVPAPEAWSGESMKLYEAPLVSTDAGKDFFASLQPALTKAASQTLALLPAYLNTQLRQQGTNQLARPTNFWGLPTSQPKSIVDTQNQIIPGVDNTMLLIGGAVLLAAMVL